MLKRVMTFVGLALVLAALLVYSQWGTEPLKVSGFIEADEIRLGSRVGGRVRRVHVEEGQEVRTDQTLVELDPFDLLERRAEAEAQLAARQADYERLKAGFRLEEIAQAKAHRDQLAARLEKLEQGPRRQEILVGRAQLELAQAQLELAQQVYSRTQGLLNQRAASPQDMDRATQELRSAQATVAVRRQELALLEEGTRPEEIEEAKAQLEEAEQASNLKLRGYREQEIAQAKAAMEAAAASLKAMVRQIDELEIKAPVDGVVEALELQVGDLVPADGPVLSLMDTRRLWVRAYVPENRLNIQIGQGLSVTVDSFPGERFAGRVSYIARQAEFTPGNVQTPEERSKQVFRIKVTLDEGLGRLRPGMAADVWLEPESD